MDGQDDAILLTRCWSALLELGHSLGRVHSIEFKRELVAEYAAQETLHALAMRHDISRNLIRIWIGKAEAGGFDDEVRASNLLTEDEARTVTLERLVGRQMLVLEYPKGALKHERSSRRVPTSVITNL